MLPGCTLSSLPSGLPFSTQPKAKAFSKQSGCFQTTGAPSFFVSVSFTLIFFLTISFSELLHQVPIKSHLWHFISRTSRFCVLALSLLQKSGSRTDISQATLLLNLRRLPCPSLFTSRQQSFMPQTRSLYNFFKAIIVPCDEISQKMKLSNTLTCCHLLLLYPTEGDQCCLVLHPAENTDACPKIIQPLFGGPCPSLEHCYSPAEHFHLFTFCW